MAQVKIHKDGTVETLVGSQEIGGGERTVALLITSAALGYLPLGRIRVSLGDSDLPRSGASGGSSTTGMLSSEIRRAAKGALEKLFSTVARSLNCEPKALEIKPGGAIGPKSGSRTLSWEEATAQIPDVIIGLLDSPLIPPDRWYVTDAEGNVLKQSGKDKYVS